MLWDHLSDVSPSRGTKWAEATILHLVDFIGRHSSWVSSDVSWSYLPQFESPTAVDLPGSPVPDFSVVWWLLPFTSRPLRLHRSCAGLWLLVVSPSRWCDNVCFYFQFPQNATPKIFAELVCDGRKQHYVNEQELFMLSLIPINSQWRRNVYPWIQSCAPTPNLFELNPNSCDI